MHQLGKEIIGVETSRIYANNDAVDEGKDCEDLERKCDNDRKSRLI